MSENKVIKAEDYEEPVCLLNMKRDNVNPIDTRRFIEKLDEYLGKNDYAGAERHLKYWLMEAKNGNDLRGEFSVANEMMGLYRKLGREAEAIAATENTLRLIDEIGLGSEIAGGTAFVNIATVLKAFGKAEKALPYYKRAKEIYENLLAPTYTTIWRWRFATLKSMTRPFHTMKKPLALWNKTKTASRNAPFLILIWQM